MIYLFLFFALIVIAIIITAKNSKKRKQSINDSLSTIPNLSISREVKGLNNDYYTFIVDEKSERIVYISSTEKKIINFADIIGVEMIEDGETIQKKSMSRTVGGAIVGGVLLGGVGAIVGGLSGGGRQKSKVSSIAIKILLRSLSEPSFSIICLDTKKMMHGAKEVDTKNLTYKKCKASADKIKDILSVIVDKNDKAASSTENIIQVKSSESLSDELLRLNDLKEKGILTDDEFQSQKQKLLNN